MALLVHLFRRDFFFGAGFTKAYANRFGSRIVPSKHAVPLSEEARDRQGMPRAKDVKAESNQMRRSSDIWSPRTNSRAHREIKLQDRVDSVGR